MAWFKVQVENAPYQHWLEIEAADKATAALVAIAENQPPNVWRVLNVRADPHHDERYAYHAHWRAKWQHALDNTPYRTRTDEQTEWVPIEGVVTVPAFIENSAHGQMRIIDGVPHQLVTTQCVVRYGQYSALARVLGYANTNKKTGKVSVQHGRVWQGLTWGHCPRGEVRQRIFDEVCGPNGCEYVRSKLAALGLLHWYD